MNVTDFFIGHDQLLTLSIFDVIIVYFFCTLQMTYNSLTAIYISKAQSKVNVTQLWRAYLFAMAPIVYSLLPILLVLYFYNPNPNVSDAAEKMPGYSFALKLVWIHLPPICLVFICILTWNIIAIKVNKKVNTWANLEQLGPGYVNQDDQVNSWDTHTKVIFRKAILKWYNKMIQEINKAEESNDLKTLLKISAKLEGWFIAKRRFQFFWCTKKAYKWIKKYYATHYEGLRYHLYNSYNNISSFQTNQN